MRKLFKKRQNVFIQMIHDQALLTLEGLEALKHILKPRIRPPPSC